MFLEAGFESRMKKSVKMGKNRTIKVSKIDLLKLWKNKAKRVC